MISRRDGRSPIAVAFGWASRITTVALGMVLPGVVGFWIDHRLGTLVLFTVLGFGLGLTVGIWSLVRMTSSTSTRKQIKNGKTGEH